VTAPVARSQRPVLRVTPSVIGLVALATLAWVGVIAYARDMGNGPGTMGMPLREFMPMWAAMMAAMMLPAVAPVATLYARTVRSDRAGRLAFFVGGYVIAWSAAGLPAFFALRLVDHFARDNGAAMRTIGVVVLASAGIYQLTPLKSRCLRHCRSPLAQLLHYGNFKGPLRDVKASMHHAAYCLGCCWALMALFIAFGVMNVWAMIGLAALVLGEKVLPRGETIGRVAGAVFLVGGLLVLASPSVAHALIPAPASMATGPMTEMSG
jgi:predicted metal-binding membrane protein